MKKTSVYLDDRREQALREVSGLTGISQAELIRSGIDQVIEQHLRPRPKMRARAHGVPIASRAAELMEGFGR
ncbi:MAG: ribbon-helix-helix domain-containing protein [Propionibacteriaceae bacterium]|nr:ribbon-helix-helix domain-containing protein [Propionibacteriaceae bacterium]